MLPVPKTKTIKVLTTVYKEFIPKIQGVTMLLLITLILSVKMMIMVYMVNLIILQLMVVKLVALRMGYKHMIIAKLQLMIV